MIVVLRVSSTFVYRHVGRDQLGSLICEQVSLGISIGVFACGMPNGKLCIWRFYKLPGRCL